MSYTGEPKICGYFITQNIGHMGNKGVSLLRYGSSKAAVSFMVKKTHYKHEGLIAFLAHLGGVGWLSFLFAAPCVDSVT
jgi:hypothetical protein